MNTEAYPWRFVVAVAAAVVALDQILKAAIVSGVLLGERVDLLPGLGLVSVRNSGIAFGLLGDSGEGLVIAVTLIALAILLVVFARAPAGPWGWLGVGLIAGGALGNLADRVREGAVVDYIKFELWPAFNLADAAITVGVVLLLLGRLQPDRSEQTREEAGEPEAPADEQLARRPDEVGGPVGNQS